MSLRITAKNFEITPEINECVEDKLAKLNKWQTELSNPRFVFYKEHGIYTVDATVVSAKGELAAHAENRDVLVAINEVVKKMETEMNKLHHKPDARRDDDSIKTRQRDKEERAEEKREHSFD
ncbi:ribosome-associated translation inhibitor RaiA [Neisseriaceae bacterium ESL0693]|nr:ribosome-associated translation inhibitor RaiA [Neisseriaceae bacterium ESL0693]